MNKNRLKYRSVLIYDVWLSLIINVHIYGLPRILNRDEPTICGFGIFTGTGNTWYSLVIFICVFVIFSLSVWNCRVVKIEEMKRIVTQMRWYYEGDESVTMLWLCNIFSLVWYILYTHYALYLLAVW